MKYSNHVQASIQNTLGLEEFPHIPVPLIAPTPSHQFPSMITQVYKFPRNNTGSISYKSSQRLETMTYSLAPVKHGAIRQYIKNQHHIVSLRSWRQQRTYHYLFDVVNACTSSCKKQKVRENVSAYLVVEAKFEVS